MNWQAEQEFYGTTDQVPANGQINPARTELNNVATTHNVPEAHLPKTKRPSKLKPMHKALIVAGSVFLGLILVGGLSYYAYSSHLETQAKQEAMQKAREAQAEQEKKQAALQEAERKKEEERKNKERLKVEEERRARAAALKNPTQYQAISDRDWSLIARAPEESKGKLIVLHGYVSQIDPNTGKSTFRASLGGEPKEKWYEYKVNTMVFSGDPALFNNVAEKDLVTVYVEIEGSMTYSTAMGGSMTVPKVKAHIIKVTGAAD